MGRGLGRAPARAPRADGIPGRGAPAAGRTGMPGRTGRWKIGWPGVGDRGLRAAAVPGEAAWSFGARSGRGGTTGRTGGWPARARGACPGANGGRTPGPAARSGIPAAGGIKEAGRGARGPVPVAWPGAAAGGMALTAGIGERSGSATGSAALAAGRSAGGAGGGTLPSGGVNGAPAARSGGFNGLVGWALSVSSTTGGCRVSAAGRAASATVAWPPLLKCVRTFSATSSSTELECVFFSVTPSEGSRLKIAFALTSSSLARSLIRIFDIESTKQSIPAVKSSLSNLE